MSSIAIITARGGSKRIPKKNIKNFCGRPIIAYSIEAARESGLFDEVMVSTDSEEIADIARRYGANVPFYRSEKTAGDYAGTNDVLMEVLEEYEKRGAHYDMCCCIYPTAPFVTAEKLKDAMGKLVASDADTLFPVVEFSYPPKRAMVIRGGLLQFGNLDYIDSRSQDLEKEYHDVGQFIFFRMAAFRKNRKLMLGKILPYVVSEMEVQDIDNEADWQIAEIKYYAMRKKHNQSMNLLLTSIGKRIELIEHLKGRFRVVGADASVENSAKHFVDMFYQIPKCRENGYVEALLAICEKEEISLLVPLYEPEFAILDEAREQFEAAGVKLVLSEGAVLDICNDKRKTAAFFEKHGIPAPKTFRQEEVEEMAQGKETAYPLVIKPVDGMGSSGVYFAKNKKELAFFNEYVENGLVQECASGKEYTIDVLCDFYGEPVYIVPRIRLEVISGEVSKSRVDLQESVIEATRRLLAALQKEGGVCGPMTVQCFLAEDGESLKFIEINPRFGGGVPLAFAVGADYATALKKMREAFADCCQNDGSETVNKPDFNSFRVGGIKELTMLRYSQAVYEA